MRTDNNLYQIRDRATNQLMHETENRSNAIKMCLKGMRLFSINNATGKKELVLEN
jgi:hypothetical protein